MPIVVHYRYVRRSLFFFFFFFGGDFLLSIVVSRQTKNGNDANGQAQVWTLERSTLQLTDDGWQHHHHHHLPPSLSLSLCVALCSPFFFFFFSKMKNILKNRKKKFRFSVWLGKSGWVRFGAALWRCRKCQLCVWPAKVQRNGQTFSFYIFIFSIQC